MRALALKTNHPTLYSQVKKWWDTARASDFQGITVSTDRRVEKAHRLRCGLLSVTTEPEGHHRTETRLVWAVPLSEFGGLYKQEQWLGLQTIVMVERTRHLWNKVTHEVQFYLSSLPADAQNLGLAIRTHWGIENQVHWTKGRNFAVRPCGGFLR